MLWKPVGRHQASLQDGLGATALSPMREGSQSSLNMQGAARKATPSTNSTSRRTPSTSRRCS